MIDVQEAVRTASKYLSRLYPSAQLQDMQLEEVELTDDEFWLVTLSFSFVEPDLPRFTFSRQYKIFKIRGENGEVVSMKIRELGQAALSCSDG